MGMGKELFESSPKAREVFERADEALGFSISKLCFEGPDDELMLTKNTQPAIVTTSIAALEALRERYPEMPLPSFVAGHSLGEYSALAAASVLSLEDAVRLVRLRGQAMQEAVPTGAGKMAAIMGGDADQVKQLCLDAAEGEAISPANFNAPGQIVIAGVAAAIDRAVTLAQDRSMRAIVLKVSAPFHCSLMEPAAKKVEEALAAVQINEPEFPVVANVDAQPNGSAARVRELLVSQIYSPVRWEESVRGMYSAGVTCALEIGPGKVLSGLVKRIERGLALKAVGTPAEVESAGEFLGNVSVESVARPKTRFQSESGSTSAAQ